MLNVMDALNWRYATKSFDPAKKVSQTDFEKLLEALRLAPSSFGLQPWKFIVVENPEVRAKLEAQSFGQKPVTEASHYIVLAVDKNVNEETIARFVAKMAADKGIDPAMLDEYKAMMTGFVSRMDQPQREAWAARQAYIALGFLLLTAAEMEIDTLPMEGFMPSAYDEILGLEAMGLTAKVSCAIGYRSAEDKYASMPKYRFAKSDVVMTV